MRVCPVIGLAICLIVGCDGSSVPPVASAPKADPLAAQVQELANVNEAQRVAAVADCKTNAAKKLTEYRTLMAKREYWPASITIRRCSELLNDKQLKALVVDGEIKSYVADIESKKNKVDDRISAVEHFQERYPESGRKYDSLLKKLKADSAQLKADYKLANHFDRKVRIGSTQQEVVEDGWGRPSGINTTTTANRVSEQWWYLDQSYSERRRYLYFENGILTAIQE